MPVAPSRLVALLVFALGSTACRADVRRFPLRDPTWKDADLAPVTVACKGDHGAATPRCAPVASSADAALSSLPFTFAAESAGAARNLNSFGEVPDSSWFTNRIGVQTMTPEELARGACGELALDPDAPDGAWVIERGSLRGEDFGVHVAIAGQGKFSLAIDDARPTELASGAAAIASRLYHAAGYWVPCSSVVHVRPAIFTLTPGLTITDASGAARALDAAALARILAAAPARGGLVRLTATRALPGPTLGPFRYEGTRRDDPRDVIAHEDRRDLRGARVLAAWLGHEGASDQSTRDVWLAREGEALSSPGVVRHYQIGLGDSFGHDGDDDAAQRIFILRSAMDPPSLGVPDRRLDPVEPGAETDLFKLFAAGNFEPEAWHGGYPNLAFARMTERDGAWAARILARFTPELIEAAVRSGGFTQARPEASLVTRLVRRQEALQQRYFARVSAIADVRVSGEDLCGADLGRATRTFADAAFSYQARVYAGARLSLRARPVVRLGARGEVCLSIPHVVDDGGAPDDAASRYVVVDVLNGVAAGPLRAHLYDLGPKRGFRLVALERPDDDAAPS